MENTSATGGPLLPGPGRFGYEFILTTDPHSWPHMGPLEGQRLEDFFHQIIEGITAIPGELIRPWIQPEPSPFPPWGTNWISLQIISEELDPGFAYELPSPPPSPPNWGEPENNGVFYIQHEFINVTTICYGPQAEWVDGLIRDGFSIAQNRELLLLTGMGLTRIGASRLVPDLIQQRWQRRHDRTIRIHREIRRLYPILQVLTARGVIITDDIPPEI